MAFIKREEAEGRGWRRLVLKAGARLAVAVAVVVSSIFLFRAAAAAFYVNR
jgi:hypothetical protein